MNYDFDVLSVATDAFQAKYAGLLARFGMTEQARKHYAMFRDPATIQAISGASREVRDCFLDSGFGLSGYDSGAGAGHYREADASPARVVDCPVAPQRGTDLAGCRAGTAFDIDAFFEAAEAATPAEVVDARFSVSFLPERAAERPAMRVTSRALSTPASAF